METSTLAGRNNMTSLALRAGIVEVQGVKFDGLLVRGIAMAEREAHPLPPFVATPKDYAIVFPSSLLRQSAGRMVRFSDEHSNGLANAEQIATEDGRSAPRIQQCRSSNGWVHPSKID
jgi:hypothetical protein